MAQENMSTPQVMRITDLICILDQLAQEQKGHFEVWLSSDEEGNDFLPMHRKTGLCLGIDQEAKKIVLFPSHR